MDNSILYKFSSTVLSGRIYKEYIVAGRCRQEHVHNEGQNRYATIHCSCDAQQYTDVHVATVSMDTLDASRNVYAAFFGMQNKTILIYAFDNCNMEVTSLSPIKVPIVPFSVLLLLSDTLGKAHESPNVDVLEGKLVFSGLDGYIGIIPFEVSQKKSKRAYTYTLSTSKINSTTILKSREGKIPFSSIM